MTNIKKQYPNHKYKWLTDEPSFYQHHIIQQEEQDEKKIRHKTNHHGTFYSIYKKKTKLKPKQQGHDKVERIEANQMTHVRYTHTAYIHAYNAFIYFFFFVVPFDKLVLHSHHPLDRNRLVRK